MPVWFRFLGKLRYNDLIRRLINRILLSKNGIKVINP